MVCLLSPAIVVPDARPAHLARGVDGAYVFRPMRGDRNGA
jgi:hypothetical protein